jgi:hypothetical protein
MHLVVNGARHQVFSRSVNYRRIPGRDRPVYFFDPLAADQYIALNDLSFVYDACIFNEE